MIKYCFFPQWKLHLDLVILEVFSNLNDSVILYIAMLLYSWQKTIWGFREKRKKKKNYLFLYVQLSLLTYNKSVLLK